MYVRKNIPVYELNNIDGYKNKGILVSRFRHYASLNTHLHTSHRHSFYHLVFFTEGSGSHIIDFKTYEVLPGSIYFMTPGQVHSWMFASEVDGYIVNFTEEYFKSFLANPTYLNRFSFFENFSSERVFLLSDPLSDEIQSVFEEILSQLTSIDHFADDLVRLLLIEIFIKVARTIEPAPITANTYNYTVLNNFRKLIDENFRVLQLPRAYAELLYITPNHLNAMCKDIMGVPAGHLIRERIILEAKRLLINMDLSVQEIANQLGFKDYSYFIRLFRKNVGQTPEKFRKTNLDHEHK